VVIAPKENQNDEHDIPKPILRQITIQYVDHMDEVLALALEPGTYQNLLTTARERLESLPVDVSDDDELVDVGTPTSSTTH
jgi:predicted ATP-dependent protease